MHSQDVKLILIIQAPENTGRLVQSRYCKCVMFWAMYSLLPCSMCQDDHFHYEKHKQILMNSPQLSADVHRTLIKMVSTNVVPSILEMSLRFVAMCICGATRQPRRTNGY